MKYSHVFLDFDETLFNHRKYITWQDGVLSELPGSKTGTFYKDFDKYHQYFDDPKLRLYLHEKHTRAVTGKGWDFISGEMEKARKNLDRDFCYTDVHRFLNWLAKQDVDVRLLTFGAGDYQRYKINTCSTIQKLRIPVHVVGQPKRQFLQREFGAVGRGVLIDDKSPLNLPTAWDEFWIDRGHQQKTPLQIGAKNYRINSLNQARQLVV